MNSQGQFSIVAALLVSVVLVAAVMTTYSAIRYSPVQGQPQILSAVDETNMALKQLLGFTVGYYGSVLKVTGNVTYAQQLAAKYLRSGLMNTGEIKPEWGLSLNLTDLKLNTNWYTNRSYSQGTVEVTYDLNGLGITGISYSTSSRLDVQISDSNSTTQAQFRVLTDNSEPLINLGRNNIKFYNYVFQDSTWEYSVPTNIISYGDGTYLADLPSGVTSSSYVVQVDDIRGISVLASSFSQFTSTITWNKTGFKSNLDYVDAAILNVLGAHSNFNAQQFGPDINYDTLTEAASGTAFVNYYPTDYYTLGLTRLTGGILNNLQSNDGAYMTFRSYGSSANQFTAQVEFTGISSKPFDFDWTMDGSASTSGVTATVQLYDFVTGQYSTSGDGYMIATLGTGDSTRFQNITTNPTSFLNSSGCWKIMITAVKSTSTSFYINLDLVQFRSDVTNYALDLQEQWLDVNATNIRQDLCIKMGTMGTESLTVQVLNGGSWKNIMTLVPNSFNNISLAPYIDSTTLTIRFIGTNDAADPTQDSWNIDAVYLKDEPDINFLINLQQLTFTVEVLQNGTMRWLGQNIQVITQTQPIPPIPVKAIHVNETINGVNLEVPFQIEDWASKYQIPLGLTSNITLFSSKQMIVFLLNSKVTDFTVWWNGSDATTQTPLGFTNKYFTNDNTGSSTLSNGNVTLQFGSFNVKSTVVGTTTSSTANFMRINQEASTYGAGLAYVIHHGVVRDVVQQEAEWNTGADGCPNLYANIVLKLSADTTYYTYQLRIMFIDSTQARSITDLCPIRLTTSLSSAQMQTENGTLAGFPIVQNGTGVFLNTTSGSWTAHHFSQYISDTGKGAGIMFSDKDNKLLYAFDIMAGSSKGAIKASNGLLELLPVSSRQAQFTYAYDVTWQGAVVTFDNTTPVCTLYDGTTPTGLWILAEYPPAVTVTPKS